MFDFIGFLKKKYIVNSPPPLTNNLSPTSSPGLRLRNDGASVFDYNFLMNLDEKDYPKYLKQAYYLKTGEKLNLRRPKTLNEKIQWLKVYDNLPIKTILTDKVLVRDWVKEKIGEEYLKPVLWIGDKFEDIPFSELPNSFIVKANHGCKWHFVVKNKDKYINTQSVVDFTKNQMNGWLSQSFFGWSDFETQYIHIKPKIIIENLLRDNINEPPRKLQVWCFNGKFKIIDSYKFDKDANVSKQCLYDDNFNNVNIKFSKEYMIVEQDPDDIIKSAAELSNKLAEGFKFVRVDWMVHNQKLYFEEMTFTPYSGFVNFSENYIELQNKYGNLLNLKGA